MSGTANRWKCLRPLATEQLSKPAPISGLDGGGFMSDLVLVPYADAMLIPVAETIDPVSVASLSDNIPDGWRAIGPFTGELASLDEVDRRVLVVGRLSIGLYAAAFAAALGAHVDYVDTDAHRLAAAEKLGAVVHDRAKPDKSWDPYPVTVHTSTDPAVLAATLRATWPDGVCTDTGVYFQGPVQMPLLSMYTRGVRFVTGRVSARAVIPYVLELLADGLDLSPAVGRVVAWEDAPSGWPAMTGKTVFAGWACILGFECASTALAVHPGRCLCIHGGKIAESPPLVHTQRRWLAQVSTGGCSASEVCSGQEALQRLHIAVNLYLIG